MTPEEKLFSVYNLHLPEPPKAAGLYGLAVQTGNLVYVSGMIPLMDGAVAYTGKVGKDLSIEQGQASARQSILNVLAVIKAHVGDLSKIRRFVMVTGYVQCADDFTAQPQVINGASQLLLDVFGQSVGLSARMALGANALPLGAATEIAAVVEVAGD